MFILGEIGFIWLGNRGGTPNQQAFVCDEPLQIATIANAISMMLQHHKMLELVFARTELLHKNLKHASFNFKIGPNYPPFQTKNAKWPLLFI